MAAVPIVSWRAAVVGRWTARILGMLMVLLFFTLAFAEGLPAPSDLTTIEKLQFLGMVMLILGLLLAWKSEGFGGLLSVAAFTLMVALSRSHLRMWAFWFPAAIRVLHIVCRGRLRTTAPAGLAPWRLPRTVVLSLPAALALFLLLCANEIFTRPPLMTPPLAPSSTLLGTWRATPTRVLSERPFNPLK